MQRNAGGRSSRRGGGQWRVVSRRQRFAAAALSGAALAVALVWGVWRVACAAGDPRAALAGPPVHVCMVADAAHVRVIAYGGFDIVSSAGTVIFTCAGPNVLRFSGAPGPAGTFYYYVVAAEFDRLQKPAARAMLTQLREALKVGMEILMLSPDLAFPKGKTVAADRMLVAIGPFNDLSLAEQWQQYLSRTYPAYIVRDSSKRATGEIHLFDHTNRLLARMKDSLTIRLRDAQQTVAAEVLQNPDSPWGQQRRTGARCRGAMEIRLNENGRLAAINVLSLEEYVRGVVPSEIGNTAPAEALKAQAVAARSEAYHKLYTDHHRGPYDFCDKFHCQTYRGIEDQNAASVAAVDATRGMVLTYGDRIIDAVYCHSCGGVSADSTDVWKSGNYAFYQAAYDRRFWRASPNLSSERQAEAWLKAAPDVFCNPGQRGFPEYARKYFRWIRRMDGATLQRLVNAERDVGRVLDVQVAERMESGRVRVLRIVGEKGSFLCTGIESVSRILNDLPSSFFILEIEHETTPPRAVKSLTIHGGGFGHGVGLCQMGAYMMAKRGYEFQDILAHYYPKTSLRQAY